MYLGLQYLIDTKVIADETVLRYLTGHPVSKITVVMFLIGMASLMTIGWNLVSQFSSESAITLGPQADESDESFTNETAASNDVRELAVDHGQEMLDLPDRLHSHYLWERLVNAVHSIYRTGSTANVEEELKYLSDIDQERQQQRYSLVRILIWATPMLGFLGTVLGISQALGGIAIGPDNDFQQMMDGLRGSLYIAFDTTALALTLSMLMMFAQFLVERFESQLLRLVDQRARSEIARHYEVTAAGSFDSQHVIEAIQNVAVDQTEIWRDSIRKAEQAWTASLTQTNDLVRSNLTESLDENIAALAHYLGEAIEKADLSISHRWSQWQVSLSENARLMEQHLQSLAQQTSSVQTIVGSLDNSTAFESALKHQQDAIMATTRTHRVLNELLEKVNEAGLVSEPEMKLTAESPAQEIESVSVPVDASEAAETSVEPEVASEPEVAAEPEAVEPEAPVEVAAPATDEATVAEEDAAVVPPVVAESPAAIEAPATPEPSAPQEETVLILEFEKIEDTVQQQAKPAPEQVESFEQVNESKPTLVDATKPLIRLFDANETVEAPAEDEKTAAQKQSENLSNSARVARSLLGESESEVAKPDVTFGVPANRRKASGRSSGSRRAA